MQTSDLNRTDDAVNPNTVDELPRSTATEPGALAERVRTVARSVQSALRNVLEAIDDCPDRPVALARTLRVDKNLAGKVLAAAIREREPLMVAQRLPAPHGLRKFLAACARHNVPPELTARAEEAVQEFDRLIVQDAGDRDALDAMITGWMPHLREAGERAKKRSLFKSFSYLLGYQVETKLTTAIIQPSENDGDACDAALVYGCYGLQRLRPGSPVVVALSGTVHCPEAPFEHASSFETLAGDQVPGHYVLEQFSTSPLPLLTVRKEGERIRHVLPEGVLGPNGSASLVFVNIMPGTLARHRRSDWREEGIVAVQWMPCKALIHDVFVRDDIWPESHPRLTTSMLRPGDSTPPGQSAEIMDQLQSSETIQFLGKGTTAIRANEIENYVEMMNHVFDKLGWVAERFRVYRLHVQYPIPYMCYAVWFDLPPKPGE